MTTAAVLVGVIFLAGLIEFVVEQAVGQWLSGRVMKIIALVCGLIVALIFRVGLIQSLGISGIDMTTGVATWADYVLTGFVIGAGSTKAHEFFDKYLTKD
jgi:uncharacterized membrane protein